MSNRQETFSKVLVTLAALMALTITASCGGGGSSVPDPDPTPQGPAAGTADLSGQFLQSGSARVSSAAGEGLAGLLVSLINTATGQQVGSEMTDSLGKFEFEGVPSGDTYLVKVEFESTSDLDGDGQLDEIELYFPVSLADQAVVALLQQIGVVDSDNDGQLDALEVESEMSDDMGHHSESHRQHRRRGGETVEDSNGNGSFGDDQGFDDSDGDGLPDVPMSEGSIDDNPSGIFELETKGSIEAISADSITVGGVTYALTSATTWRIGDNRSASPAEFTVGMFVEAEGISDGSGGWIATKVKTEDDFGGTGGDDTPGIEREVKGFIEAISESSITVGGVTFALTSSTTWRIGDNRSASPAEFTVGMFVEAEGLSDGAGGWTATKVKTEDDAEDDNGGGDDEPGDDNGGQGGDDEPGDDNGGQGGDDEPGDDNGGQGGDDEPGDDNGGQGEDDEPGDDNGGQGGDDEPGDDNGGQGEDDEPGDDNGGQGEDDEPGDDNGGQGEDEGDEGEDEAEDEN